MFGMLGMFDPQGTGGAGGGSTFSPSELFAAGEQGVWYDPSDFSTMFQDSAGTTPVTAIEQPVGLLLDKSKNGVGTNGAFRWNLLAYTEQFDNAVWVKSGATVATTGYPDPVGGNTAEAMMETAVSSTHRLTQSSSLTVGVSYKFRAYVKGLNRTWAVLQMSGWTNSPSAYFNLVGAGSVGVTTGSPNASITSVGSDWYLCTIEGVANATSGIAYLFAASADGVGTYLGNASNGLYLWGASFTTTANASLPYQPITDTWYSTIPGNHATQSTSAKSPILRNRYNLLTYTEQFDNAAWSKTNTSIGANVTDPIGTTTAKTLTETATTADHYVSQQVGSPSAIQYTFSIYAKANTRRYFWLILIDGSTPRKRYTVLFDLVDGVFLKSNSLNTPTGTGYGISNAGGGWWRMSITMTMANVANNVFAQFGLSDSDNPTFTANGYVTYTGDGTSGVYIWGTSFTVANESTIPYQWVTTGTAGGYNTDTTLFKPFLAFDGTDDVLVTNNIDFSSTDQMSVFAGVRKLSDAKVGVVAELSADIAANNGTFLLSAPNSAAANYNFSSKGTTQADNTITTYTSPITNVITGLSDISASVNIVRANAAASTYATSTQGTGNYGTYPLYIGWRGGVTASTQFTGRIYSLIIRNALTESTLLGQTETWVNGKTGAY